MKPSLAAAYAAKHRMRKMAKGGEVNEMLHPEHEPEHGAAEAVLEQQRLKPFNQNHDHLVDHAVEPDTGKKYYASPENMPAHMLAKGGMVEKIMAKRRMNFAQGGQVPESMDYLKLNDSYPDPDLYETDPLDPHQPDFGEDPKMKRKKMIKGIFSAMDNE